MKSIAMQPPRNNPIPNQDITRTITPKYTILPPHLEKVPTGHKPFIDDTHFSNPTENKHNDSTDNSRTDNEYSVDKMNVDKN